TLLAETTIVVCSEFGRTPELNGDNGKDHHPWTSMVLLGKGVKGGTTVGTTDGNQEGVKTNFNNGAPDDTGLVLDVTNMVAGLVTLMGANSSDYMPTVPPFTATIVRRFPVSSLALVLVLAGATAPRTARAVLDTEGFRAVAVAQTPFPISAIAVAPDGRLFAAIQEMGQTTGATPGTAEIRVFSAYRTTDGSTLDQGTLWATVDGVRATTMEEGLLGLALAPDFATSKLVYVYLTTTDEDVNQHIRVYRENAQ